MDSLKLSTPGLCPPAGCGTKEKATQKERQRNFKGRKAARDKNYRLLKQSQSATSRPNAEKERERDRVCVEMQQCKQAGT